MRPSFHFSARAGWINDPHGITFRDGEYHVFFQYVPDSTVWAPNCHWGHAKGPDLFTLEELSVAIAPGEGDEGIWTGSLVTDDTGSTRVFYTSTSQPDIGIGRVRIANPDDDDWSAWTKGSFVADAPRELDIVAYRDPFLLRETAGWRMFLGAGLADGTATALSYRSENLESWTYEGIALQRSTHETEPVWMGALWECPQIIQVDGRHVMISSVWDDDVLHYAGYAVGDYADGRFDATSWGRLTHGPSYYAPSFFRDAEGRACLMFWMRGIADFDQGWASVLSVPHVLTLEGDTLVATPHPDLERYREPESAEGVLPSLAGDVVWKPAANDELRVTDGQKEVLRLVVANGELSAHRDGESSSVPVGESVRVILDANAVEVSSTQGILALAIAPAGRRYDVRAACGQISIWPLSR